MINEEMVSNNVVNYTHDTRAAEYVRYGGYD